MRLRKSLIGAGLIVLLVLSCGVEKTDKGTGIPDSTPPAQITDLAAINPTDSSLTLVWIAPGDDDTTGTAAQYDIRFDFTILTDSTWDSALQPFSLPLPQEAGTPETMLVIGLEPDTTYYFGIKAADEVPNWSGISNIAPGTTEAVMDTIPPAAITDLRVTDAGYTFIELSWTVPGDDGTTGNAAAYDIRFSQSEITAQNFVAADHLLDPPFPLPTDSTQTFTFYDLDTNTTYYFAIKTADEVPNWSPISNVVMAATAADTIPPAAVNDLRVADSTASSVTLAWTAPGDDDTLGRASFYDIRYSINTITTVNFVDAQRADFVPVPAPSGTEDSVKIAGLGSGTHYYFAIKTADEAMNWSELSNVVEGKTLVEAMHPVALIELTYPTANMYIGCPMELTATAFVSDTSDIITKVEFFYQNADSMAATVIGSDLYSDNGIYHWIWDPEFSGALYLWATATIQTGETTVSDSAEVDADATNPEVNLVEVGDCCNGGETHSTVITIGTVVPIVVEAWDRLQADGYGPENNCGLDSVIICVKMDSVIVYRESTVPHDEMENLFVADWATIGLPKGTYDLYATTSDFCCNSVESEVWHVSIVDSIPTVTLAVNEAVEVEGIWVAGTDEITIQATSGTGADIDSIQFWYNSIGKSDVYDQYAHLGTDANDTRGVFELSEDVAEWAEGTYRLRAVVWVNNRCTDDGNDSDTEFDDFTFDAVAKVWQMVLNIDHSAPVPIVDLRPATMRSTSVLLNWSAPGDDSLSNHADAYEIRYAQLPITEESWPSAMLVENSLEPQTADSPEQFTVEGLLPNTMYYIAIRSADTWGNWSNVSNSARVLTASAPHTWHTVTGYGYSGHAYSAALAPAGGCVAVGELGGAAIFLMVDADGNVVWERRPRYGNIPAMTASRSVVSVDDGGFIAVGIYNTWITPESAYSDLYLMRFDEYGEFSWVNTLSSMVDWQQYIEVVHQTQDGNVVTIWEYGSYYATMLKAACTGQTIWKKAQYASAYHYCGCYDICSTPDGSGHIIVGGKCDYSSQWGDVNTYIFETDSFGKFVRDTTFGGDAEDIARGVVALPNGEYLIAGWTKSFGHGSKDIHLMRIDSTFNMINEMFFGGGADDAAYAITATSDGNYAIAGSTMSFGAGSTDIYLAKVSAAGVIIWEKILGGEYFDIAFDVIEAADGGLFIVGSTSSYGYGKQSVYIIKTDANGEL